MASRTLLSRKTLGTMLPRGAAILGFSRGLGLCQLRKVQTFSLPDLPYDYSALEPAISGEIMRLHHQKHHQTYVTNFNKALEQLDEAMAKRDSATIVQLQGAIKFNGGGHINHSIFWKNLAPIKEGGGEPPKGALGWAIDDVYGSPEAVIRKMNAEGAALQGSGWVWLALDKEMKKVTIETTANQEFYDSEEETGRDVLRGNEEDARRANSTSKFKFSKFGCRIWNLSGSYIISLLKRVSVNYMRQLRSSKRDDMQKDAQV